MSYSQKIKSLLQKMKKLKINNNSQKNSNISRNYINDNKNTPLINAEICMNNMRRYPIKKYQNKFQTSNDNKYNDSNNNYINKDYKNNKKNKFNNNFIIETNYENNILRENNDKNIRIYQSYKDNPNYINISNKNNSNNIITFEKRLLFDKLSHIKTDNSSSNIYTSNYKVRNLSNSEDEIHNNAIYLSSSNKDKKKLSSYILKNKNKELKVYTNNTSPINFSSYFSKKNVSNNSKFKYKKNITNINDSFKNISSRIMKKQPIISLSELFSEEKNKNSFNNLSNKKINYKYLKKKLLMVDDGYKIIYNNEDKKNKFKRNCNSTSNLRERDNHSGGKIILALDENSSRRKSRKKTKNNNYYIIKIQSFWRGYILRKLIKITKELFLLFIPFINKIKKEFDKHKKKYFLIFKKNLKKYLTKKSPNIKDIPNNNNKIKKKIILYNKNDNNIKNKKFMKKYITTAPILDSKKRLNIKEKNIERKMNDIMRIKIDNTFYQKKKLSFNKHEANKNKIFLKDNRKNTSTFNLKKYKYILPNKGLIKRTSYKRFYNVSPDFRNIELNINNKSLKNSLYEQKNNLNNYSSSISIFFQTQFPESKINSLKNLVYVNKNKKPKNSIRSDIFEKIKIKIFNNFYLTLYKCIKKSMYRFYWNKLSFKLNQNNKIILNNEKKSHILNSIITKITYKIKKYYFRKYRENILIEKIKTKLFYLTDYSRTKSNIFKNKNKKIINRIQKLIDIYMKYKNKTIINHYFSIWKMNIYYNFIKIDFPLSTTRSKYSKQNIHCYINKIINFNIDEFKDPNEQKKLIYKKNNSNYMRKNERIPINAYLTQSQSYANHFFSPYNNIKFPKYNKKHITNQNSLLNNSNNNLNYYYSKKVFPKNKFKKILDNINIKKEKIKYFNLLKTKLNNKRKYIKVNNRFSFYRNKFLKYFFISLKLFLQKEKVNNKNKIGLALFVWYRKTFIIYKRNKNNYFHI